jgi:hypothetical protein
MFRLRLVERRALLASDTFRAMAAARPPCTRKAADVRTSWPRRSLRHSSRRRCATVRRGLRAVGATRHLPVVGLAVGPVHVVVGGAIGPDEASAKRWAVVAARVVAAAALCMSQSPRSW